MEVDEHETPIIFRKTKERGYAAEITAVFPAEPGGAGDNMWELTCYAHVGQHGTCHIGWYQKTKPAKPEEYASLKRELEGFGYRVRVYQRMNKSHRKARRAEIERLRALRVS